MSLTMATFELPMELNAAVPPERRGIRRDHVNLMVLDRRTGRTEHTRFDRLDGYLTAGDLLVLNANRTIAAVLHGVWNRDGLAMGEGMEIRLARKVDDETWHALPVASGVAMGDVFSFGHGLTAVVTGIEEPPFSTLRFSMRGSSLLEAFYTLGEPVRYEYITQPWELDCYQTVYASAPGSVEMPSAGRAFSWELLFKLRRQGVAIAFVQLHTGLSYLLDDMWHRNPRDNFEQYAVPGGTVEAIRQTQDAGGRVIAVGTTVVRALESCVDAEGRPAAGSGWTNLMIDRSVPLRVADGLITGFHEPEASHLDMLSAFAAPELLHTAYQDAIRRRYLWHEFGDMNLIL